MKYSDLVQFAPIDAVVELRGEQHQQRDQRAQCHQRALPAQRVLQRLRSRHGDELPPVDGLAELYGRAVAARVR